MIFTHRDYKSFLKESLVSKKQKNGAFSLRALARMTKIQPSLLSNILNGDRELTEEGALKVAQGLGLDSAETEYFILLVQYSRAKSPELKETIRNRIQAKNPVLDKEHDLSLDHFRIISDWHHMAILRALEIPGAENTSKRLAEKLRIDPLEVGLALERLERLELVARVKKNTWKSTRSRVLIQSAAPNDAIKKFHKQMLEKIIQAQDTLTPGERYSGTETLTISVSKMKQAHQAIEECFAKLVSLSQKPSTDSQVIHFGIYSIPLTQKIKNEGAKIK